MNHLTNQEMEEAIFALHCQDNAVYGSGSLHAKNIPFIENDPSYSQRVKDSEYQYWRGSEVLRRYRIHYSERTAVPFKENGDPAVLLPADTANFLLVQFGTLNNAVYRFICFIPR